MAKLPHGAPGRNKPSRSPADPYTFHRRARVQLAIDSPEISTPSQIFYLFLRVRIPLPLNRDLRYRLRENSTNRRQTRSKDHRVNLKRRLIPPGAQFTARVVS